MNIQTRRATGNKHITGACDIIEERYGILLTTQRKTAGHKACYDGS